MNHRIISVWYLAYALAALGVILAIAIRGFM